MTSVNNSRKEKINRTYPLRDLVIPIPNFVSDYNSDWQALCNQLTWRPNSTLLVNASATTATQKAAQRLAENSGMNLDSNPAALGQFGGLPGMPPGMGGMGGMVAWVVLAGTVR